MTASSFIVIFIGFVFLIALLTRRSRKMTVQEDFTTFLEMFACWGLVFYGTFQISELSVFNKIAIVIVDSFAWIIIGAIYFYRKNKRAQIISQTTESAEIKTPTPTQVDKNLIIIKKSDLLFWFVLVVNVINALLSYYFGIFNLQYILLINNVPVVTFYNLIGLGYLALGTIFVVAVGRALKLKRKRI